METDQEYIVETVIEADVTSADTLRTCHASRIGVTGVALTVGTGTVEEIAKTAVRDSDRWGWLESFLKLSAGWSTTDVHGAHAQYQVRAKVHFRSVEGLRMVGESAFDETSVIGRMPIV